MPVKATSQRLVLREKVDRKLINPVEESLYRILKVNEYSHTALNLKEQNDFCELIQFKYNIDLKDLLRALGLGNQYHITNVKTNYVIRSHETVFRRIAELAEFKININYDMATEMCHFWNNIIIEKKLTNYSKIKDKADSKTFISTAILLTHILYFKAHSIENLKRCLQILLEFGSRIPNFTKHRHSIYTLFSYVLNDQRQGILFSCRNGFDFVESVYYKGSKHDTVFNGKVKRYFIKYFFNSPLKGEQVFKQFKIKLSKWFDSISVEFTNENSHRETCGLKLIKQNQNCNSLIEEYFAFLSMQKVFVSALDITKETWWISFVDHVRYNLGYSDFWKIKPQVDKRK